MIKPFHLWQDEPVSIIVPLWGSGRCDEVSDRLHDRNIYFTWANIEGLRCYGILCAVVWRLLWSLYRIKHVLMRIIVTLTGCSGQGLYLVMSILLSKGFSRHFWVVASLDLFIQLLACACGTEGELRRNAPFVIFWSLRLCDHLPLYLLPSDWTIYSISSVGDNRLFYPEYYQAEYRYPQTLCSWWASSKSLFQKQ